MLRRVDPLLGGDREIGDRKERVMVFSARSAKQQLKINRGTIFSVPSVISRTISSVSLWSGVNWLVSELENCCGSVLVSCCS
jgi:hypothetical protein